MTFAAVVGFGNSRRQRASHAGCHPNRPGRWKEEAAEEVDAKVWSWIWWVAEASRSKGPVP